MYDLIIIGSGPAGLTAAIYAIRARLECLILEKEAVSGGQVINTYEVDNYPGLPGISGFELSMKMKEHAEGLGAEFRMENVKRLELNAPVKRVITSKNAYEAKTVLIATGTEWKRLGVKGEDELQGMGVSYCATCDGAFFKNKVTAVVGGGDVAIEDAIFLARTCKKVYLIHRRDELRAAKMEQEILFKLDNVEILWNTTVEEILGQDKAEEVILKDNMSGELKRLPVDGVFIAVGTTPNSKILDELVEKDQQGYIIANEDCHTNIPGVFVAGDLRTKPLRQVVTAASDGANAIYSIEKYLYTL